MRSWTLHPPDFVLEEFKDSEAVPSPIQVLLVGSFYVNFVSEEHAKALNEFHKTSIKAGFSFRIEVMISIFFSHKYGCVLGGQLFEKGKHHKLGSV